MIAQNYHYTSLETKAKRLSINLSITKATCRTVEQYETLSQINTKQGGRQIEEQGREGRKAEKEE